ILSIQLTAKANETGIRITPRHIFEQRTISKLVKVAGDARRVNAEQGPVIGAVPLTPVQRWFFEQELADADHWNQAVLLETQAELDNSALGKAIAEVLKHHDALRARFKRESGVWRQTIIQTEEQSLLDEVDLNSIESEKLSGAIEAEAERLQKRLNLERGPLMRVGLMNLGHG